MKTLYYPCENTSNKYVNIIIEAISQNGIEVDGFSKKNILRNKYKIVNFNWFENIGSNNIIKSYLTYMKKKILIKYLKLQKMKIIWTLHNKVPHDVKNTSYSIRLMKQLTKDSDAIVIHCKETIQVIQNLNPTVDNNKIVLIPHPNFIDVYNKGDINYRKQLKIETDEMVYLFVGQIRPYKNVELIIEAAKQQESYKKIKFIIAGKPINKDYENKLKELAGDNDKIIFIFEYIEDNNLTSLIEASDIIILPYDTKSSLNSGSAILAFSHGKTIICPQIGTLKDMPNQNLFYTYNYKTNEEHLDCIKCKINDSYNDFINKKMEFLNKGLNLQRIMENNYSIKIVSEKYKMLYDSLVD